MYQLFDDKIKSLIKDLYVPGGPGIGEYDLRLTTEDVAVQLTSVIPANYIDEPTVFRILEELGYRAKYDQKHRIVEKESETEKDKKGRPKKTQVVETYDDLTYFWYFKKIDKND